VSVYIRTPRGAQQEDHIRWKNQVRAAEAMIDSQADIMPGGKEVLAPAHDLYKNGPFWHHVVDGVAGFFAPGLARIYRLPVPFTDQAVAANVFHVKPLLPLFNGEGPFFILVLSRRRGLRLFRGANDRVHELDLTQAPEAAQRAYELGDESPRPGPGNPQRGGPVRAVHGFDPTGMQQYDAREPLKEYFHQVDRGLREWLRGEFPLVLAGEPGDLEVYRQANSYPHLVEAVIECHTEQLTPDHYRDRAHTLVQDHFRQSRARATAMYKQLAGTGRTAHDLQEVLNAAYQGHLQYLFVDQRREQWGKFDPVRQTGEIHDRQEPGDQDLHNLAAVYALTHKTTVYSVDASEMPDTGPLAAIYWTPMGERSSKRTLSDAMTGQ
jgi:hypothetical protein